MTADLVIRYSASEHSLRSTGDLAGVLVVSRLGGLEPTLAVDSSYDPELYPLPTGSTTATFQEDGISPTATPVDAGDVVDACIGDQELRHLYALVGQGLRDGLPILLGAQAFDAVRAMVDLVEDVAAKVESRLEES